jgi:hypothetical protein
MVLGNRKTLFGRLLRPGSAAGPKTKPNLSLSAAAVDTLSATDDVMRPHTATSEASEWNQPPATPSKAVNKIRYIKASIRYLLRFSSAQGEESFIIVAGRYEARISRRKNSDTSSLHRSSPF